MIDRPLTAKPERDTGGFGPLLAGLVGALAVALIVYLSTADPAPAAPPPLPCTVYEHPGTVAP